MDVSVIPAVLRDLPQWVTWDPSKPGLPLTTNCRAAKTNDPQTWADFEQAIAAGRGIGFVFSTDDPFVGIDFDGCRNPANGLIEPWAQKWIDAFATYTEVSPSGSGVHCILRGKSPFPTGRNVKLDYVARVSPKDPGVEVYDHGRWFAFTGWATGDASDVADADSSFDDFCRAFFPVPATPAAGTLTTRPAAPPPTNTDAVGRAREYIARIDPAISGQGGHKTTFYAAASIVQGFDLPLEDAYRLLCEYNERCVPPWSEAELRHKIEQADKLPGLRRGGAILPRGRLLTESLASHGGTLASIDFDQLAEERAAEQAVESPTEGVKPEKKAKSPPRFTQLLTSAELRALDCSVEYLVEGTLVRGQPGIIGGRSKTLKTSTIIDLCVSLGSGSPFLGQFPAQRAKVAYWSGESGAPTIQAKAIACCKARGIRLDDVDVCWSFDLPKLGMADHLVALYDLIRARKFDVVVIDPLYLSLLDANTASGANNLFAMGAALSPVAELGQATGATVLLAHHFRKSSAVDPDEPAALEELSQSGAAEWARQWILLARREPYTGHGRHALWLRLGGSAGHASLHAYDADEGNYLPDNTDWRRWEVTVRETTDVRAEMEARKEERKQAVQASKEEGYKERLLEALASHPEGETARTLREEAGLNSSFFAAAVRLAIQEERIEPVQIRKGGRAYEGFRLTENAGINWEIFVGTSGTSGTSGIVPVRPSSSR